MMADVALVQSAFLARLNAWLQARRDGDSSAPALTVGDIDPGYYMREVLRHRVNYATTYGNGAIVAVYGSRTQAAAACPVGAIIREHRLELLLKKLQSLTNT